MFCRFCWSNVSLLSSNGEITWLSQGENEHMDYTSQRNVLGRAFSQLVLNTCFSCSNSSDISSVISNFLACIKDDSKGLSLLYCPFLFGRYEGWEDNIGVFKVKQTNLVHKKHSSPGELTVLAELLNRYSRVGTWVNFQVNRTFGYITVKLLQLYSK